MQPKLSVVIISWNTRDLLSQALDSIYATYDAPDRLEVLVVDNASTDGTPEIIRETYPQVRLIALNQNIGFAGGNNRGLAAVEGDMILLLNSDAQVLPGALSAMADYLTAHPSVGLVGPKLLNADGTPQSSRRRFPTLPVLFFESTWLEHLAPKRSLRRFYVEDIPESSVQEVDWVTGAAMMVRRQVVSDVGGLDEGYFMYSEELDWCRRIRQAGWAIGFTPNAEVVHYGGKSSEQVVASRHIYFQASKVRYAHKFHGRLVAEMLRAWLLLQYTWQIALEGGKWLLGHRREMRAARVKAYGHVLRSRLRQPQPVGQPRHSS